MSKIEILDPENYFDGITERVHRVLVERERGRPFHLFLSGGSTPKKLYSGLADSDIDWTDIHLWWGDERFVPHDHADSNFRMVRESLIDKVKLSPQQVHPWPILSTPELSAETYDREFRETFQQRSEQLSLQLLGMGDDGHTASLFPGTQALREADRHCVENYVPGKDSVRLTLTYPALSLSRRIVFLVRGEGKAQALREVLEEKRHPASRVECDGDIEYWIDREAGSKLSS